MSILCASIACFRRFYYLFQPHVEITAVTNRQAYFDGMCEMFFFFWNILNFSFCWPFEGVVFNILVYKIMA